MIRRILVTSALPYANGPIHLGHLVEYIQTDIWVRFQRSCGHEIHYVCADDAHGTAIMLKAESLNMAPEQLIQEVSADHQRDFAGFHVAFDHYHSTHSPENRHFSSLIYERNRDANHIAIRSVRQFFDPERQLFLADRFIKGQCPKCASKDQYGDSCEQCGATYGPTDLIDPYSTISGARPVLKESDHYFFRLPDFRDLLESWTRGGHLQTEVSNKLNEWFAAGLNEWDISRDAPYFGFEIPDAPGKYFYVWLDAPIGYMASFQALCQRTGMDFSQFWSPDSTTELYHFIGKDIVYFHALFWPAMLHGAGFRLPTGVFAHGFLTVSGIKMSKSRGTFIKAKTYLEHLNPDALRYYFAAKLSNHVEDIDLNLDDFVIRVNADLVGKIVNIASRCAGFMQRSFNNQLVPVADPLLTELIAAGDTLADGYEQRQFSRVVRDIMALADRVNQRIDEQKPWALAKINPADPQIAHICSLGIECFRQLITYLAPIIPQLAEASSQFLNVDNMHWNNRHHLLGEHEIRPFKALLQRIDPAQVQAMVAASCDDLTQTTNVTALSTASQAVTAAATPDYIDIDTFKRLDLRLGKIVLAEQVEGADKLLRLLVDLNEDQPRQLFAGIRHAYPDPSQLIGQLVVVVANLQPRRMKFGVSEGMVLAAGPGGADIFLLHPEAGALPGMRVQ